MPLIAPHGGKLVNRVLEGQAAADATRQAETLTSIAFLKARRPRMHSERPKR